MPEARAVSEALSYISPRAGSPWLTYLAQVDRVLPLLGELAVLADTLRRPTRALIVDIPIQMDDGSLRGGYFQNLESVRRAAGGGTSAR